MVFFSLLPYTTIFDAITRRRPSASSDYEHMIIRMLRAGAGTWPVARPKRADKIMRRIRLCLL